MKMKYIIVRFTKIIFFFVYSLFFLYSATLLFQLTRNVESLMSALYSRTLSSILKRVNSLQPPSVPPSPSPRASPEGGVVAGGPASEKERTAAGKVLQSPPPTYIGVLDMFAVSSG